MREGRKRSGFTLAEMMLTLALVALIYTMVSTILIQISRYVKAGREVARERYLLLKTVEDLRYQLRSLYLPQNDKPGLIGKRTPVDGRDSLQFLTCNGSVHKGVVEGTYMVRDDRDEVSVRDEENSSSLYYREFPFRRAQFRTLDPFEEAPWKVKLSNVRLFELEYSAGGNIFQREWDQTNPPLRVRLRIARGGENRDRLVFDVTPGVGAGRW